MASLFGKPAAQGKWFGNKFVRPPSASGLVNPYIPEGYGNTAFTPPGSPEEIAEDERRREEEERIADERQRREFAEGIQGGGDFGGNQMGGMYGGQADPGMPGGYHDPNDPFAALNIYASNVTGPTPYGIPVNKTLNETLLGVNDETAAASAEQISQQFQSQGLPSMNTPHAVDQLSDPAFGYLMDAMGGQDATANAMAMDNTPGQMSAATGINTGYGSASDTSFGDHSGLAAFGGAGSAVAADGAGGDGADGTVICTALYNQGFLPLEVYRADAAYGRHLDVADPSVRRGYLMWATPIAKAMTKSRTVAALVAPLALPWAQHIYGNENWLGALYMKLGVPLCRWLGKIKPIKGDVTA